MIEASSFVKPTSICSSILCTLLFVYLLLTREFTKDEYELQLIICFFIKFSIPSDTV